MDNATSIQKRGAVGFKESKQQNGDENGFENKNLSITVFTFNGNVSGLGRNWEVKPGSNGK